MKNTLIIEIDGNHIEENKLRDIARLLKQGGTVAFPTETVYGLGGNALDPEAVKEIFVAKGRPSDNPLIVHIAKMEDVEPLVKEIPSDAWRVMEAFWPGPLTIVLQKSAIVPEMITAGLSTVAIRMPSHPIAIKLIEMAQVPVAAPSANISGKPSPTRGEHVVKDLKGKVDAIIVGGSCDVGVESTVLDMTTDIPTILRPGGITREMLLKVLPRVVMDAGLKGEADVVPKSPGMKYTHYAPRAEVYIVKGEGNSDVEKIRELAKTYRREGKKVGIMCFDESYRRYEEGIVKSMGSRRELGKVAANLFKVLRDFDETDVEIILAEALEEVALGQAIMNRLTKAAAYKVIEGDGKQMKTILFVCTGNTCRSSMAESLFKDLLEKEAHNLGDIRVTSAGTSAMVGEQASRASKEIIGEKGLSLEGHRSKPLTKELIEDADLILTMTSSHKSNVLMLNPEAKGKVYTLKEYVNKGESSDEILDKMNEVYKDINKKKQQFMVENQKKLKMLKEKREMLLKELDTIEKEVVRIEKEFKEVIAENEDQLILLKTQLPEVDIMDPFGQPLDVYRESAREIEESLKKLLKKLSKK